MAESQVVASPVPSTSTKKVRSRRKTTGSKKHVAKTEHPAYNDMIIHAVKELKEHRGSSRQAILKFLMTNNKVGSDLKVINAHLKMALKRMVKTGVLKQAKGIGASGSFRLGEHKPIVKKMKAKSPAKPKTTEKKAHKPKTSTPGKPKKQKKVVKKPAVAKSIKKPKVSHAKPVKKTMAKKPKATTATKRKTVTPKKVKTAA